MVSEGIDDLYRRHVGELVHFATVLVGPTDAVDVVSDAVLATLRRGSLDNVDNVRAYWFRAVANTAASHHRSRFRRLRREHSAREVRAEPTVSEPAADARRLLSGLTAQQRSVIYLTYWHDLAPAQVAEMLGVSDGTVRKQLGRAREQLREVLRHD
jgi:RNA polymerase sigma factor (sigma-70 family)